MGFHRGALRAECPACRLQWVALACAWGRVWTFACTRRGTLGRTVSCHGFVAWFGSAECGTFTWPHFVRRSIARRPAFCSLDALGGGVDRRCPITREGTMPVLRCLQVLLAVRSSRNASGSFEHPLSAYSWKWSPVIDMCSAPGCEVVDSAQCLFGRPHRTETSLGLVLAPSLAARASCSTHPVRLAGSLGTTSAEYHVAFGGELASLLAGLSPCARVWTRRSWP